MLCNATNLWESNGSTIQLAQKQKQDVKMMFQSYMNQDRRQKLNFIYSLQHFGISYLFQQEINHLLEQIYNSFVEDTTIIH